MSITVGNTLPTLEPTAPVRRPTGPATDLRAELLGLDTGATSAARDGGRILLAQALQPGQGYFNAGNGQLHIGPWNVPRIQLPDGRTATAIGQVRLPTPTGK